MIIGSDRNLRDNQGDGAQRAAARAVATELYTLGGVRAMQQGAPLEVTLGARHLALLIFLFHERRPMHPAEVVELLGHGHDHDRELDGLKRSVKWLNQHVPSVNIRLTAETVEGVSGVWLDTMDVEAAIDARKPARVADLYVGEFLEGFESGAHAFEEWANRERGRLKRAWDHAISRAAREAESEGKWRTAAAWWKVVVARAPMRSEPVARLLGAYARTGRLEEAIKTYSDYTERLSRSGVSEVAEAVRQVIARFPLLQGIAATPFTPTANDAPLAEGTPEPERQSRVWDLEPAPAPSDAFDLPFELPEVGIPTQSEGPRVAQTDGAATDSKHAPSTRSFHALDQPLRADFRMASARNRVSKSADPLVVDTVAMSFEKIATRPESDSSDGNGGAHPSSELGGDPPEGFTDNASLDWHDGNGNPKVRDVPSAEHSDPPPESDHGTAAGQDSEPASDRQEESATESARSLEGESRGPVPQTDPSHKSAGPPRYRQEQQMNRDLYRATAAILAAFVDNSDDEDEPGGNGHLADFPLRTPRVRTEQPERYVPEALSEVASAPPEDGPAAMPCDHPESGLAEHELASQTVLFDPSESTEFDLSDLDLDDFEHYGGHVTRVRHQVTSVRKPWDPVLRRAWTATCQWLAQTVGALRNRVSRSLPERYPTSAPEALPEPVEHFEAWASEPPYEPSRIVYPEASESPPAAPPQSVDREDPARGDTSRENRQKLAADEVDQLPPDAPTEWQEEAHVEWYDHWDDDQDDAAFDKPYGVEVDVYSPALSSSFEPAVEQARSSLLRRYWYAPVGVALVVAVLAVANSIGLFGGRGVEAADPVGPSSPSPSLPMVTVRTPGFIGTSISKIGRLFSGSILDGPGEWVLVADLSSNSAQEAAEVESTRSPSGSAEISAAAATLALEADLMQARHFFVFLRGRALVSRGSETAAAAEALTIDQAISIAAAQGISAVIGGTLYRRAGGEGDSVVLEVFRPTGERVYRESRRVTEQNSELAALAELTLAVRRRLGEPPEDLEASVPLPSVLSADAVALNSYAEAFEHFQAGRYREAGAAASAAARRDSTFAAAHYLLARSLMASGARREARTALDAAVESADGTSERERLRILGNWLTLTGRLSEAALTYDELFDRHRDDVAALRSQAVVQRMIGAPGEGIGNLRVAHTIDPYDWPRLAQLARELGYQGRLPSVDSLKVLANSASTPAPND